MSPDRSPFCGVVVLDRDGTINIDKHYLSDPQQLEFLPGSAAGLRLLREQGCRVVVISNQSGVGRGLMTSAMVDAVHQRLCEMVTEVGGQLAGIYYCPHHPDDGCACRKPGTALLQRAACDFGFDPARAIVAGDKSTDIEMGRRMGARTILIAEKQHSSADHQRATYVASNLLDAAVIIGQLSDDHVAFSMENGLT